MLVLTGNFWQTGREYTGTETSVPLPEGIRLFDNYPNPFNPSTVICFRLDRPARVRLTIYNMLGKEVKTLIDGGRQSGDYSLVWDGTGRTNGTVPADVYVCRFQTGHTSLEKKCFCCDNSFLLFRKCSGAFAEE